MSQINRPPVGLQGLLGSQNFGQNPNDLAQQVLPIVDLFPFWSSQTLKFDKQTGTSAGGGSLIETQVPTDKTWGVLSCAFALSMATLNLDYNMQIAIDENATGTEFFVVASRTQVGNLKADIPIAALYQPRHIVWLPPGYVIRGVFNSDGTGDASVKTFELDTVYYELDV